MLYTLQPGCPHSRGSPLHCAPGVDGVWCTFERTIPRQKSSLPQAKSSFRHHPIWCRANRHHSNAPPSMFFATARQKRRWYHHIRPPPDARWTNVDSGRMLYPPPSLCLNVFLLLLFRSIEKIFSWRCDSHLQGDMRRGDGATVLSGTTIAVDVDAMRRRVKKLRFFAPVEDDDDVWSAHDGGWWLKKRGFFPYNWDLNCEFLKI